MQVNVLVLEKFNNEITISLFLWVFTLFTYKVKFIASKKLQTQLQVKRYMNHDAFDLHGRY